jgi:ketosteroid isomerase-like protein
MSRDLLSEHLARFNEGVRSGDFEPMLELFADDAELAFEGVPVGPFHGIDAIRDAYRERPPDDEIEVLDAHEAGDTIVAPYSWRRDVGRRSGEMRLTVRDDRIARLVVTFD